MHVVAVNGFLSVYWKLANIRTGVTNGGIKSLDVMPTDQVNEVDPGPGTKVLFVATSDHLPSHPAKKVGEPQTGVSPLLGLVSVVY